MMGDRLTIRLAVLFLLLGTSLAWSQRQHKKKDSPISEDAHVQEESKLRPRYSEGRRGSHGYILEEDDHDAHHGDGKAEEYVDSEEQKSHKEQEEALGKEDLDKTVKDDEYDDHSEKGGFQEFKAGGASFDKHLKDHKADNKEIENIKQHDAGEKFGGEATKEHKLGKNKEKSKGHKLHGFKNVYHKEEYGDHKTFHDEFLDSDHQHNYDDQHEHQEMQGGKFSKGFKHEGKNKKFDKGDEKHEWGKEEYDGNHQGKHDKGKQSTKHRHGSKKHQSQYDANSQRNKNSVHKVKKGSPPSYVSHGSHHGPHQAQIQPYVSHHSSHHEQAPADHYKPHNQEQSHHASHYDDDKDKSYESHGNHNQNHENHHSNHDHGGHHNHDHGQNYSQDDDNHSSEYEERTPLSHRHRNPIKGQLEDKSLDIHRQEPIAHKQAISSRFGTQHYRQPVYQERSHFKQPEYIRQEKYSHPFSERSSHQNHRVRYGFQPRNHHHHSHHQPDHHHHKHLQPFPRFPEASHQHHAHDHSHHTAHKKHLKPLASDYHQQPRSDTHALKTEQTDIKPRNEEHGRFSQKHYE